VNAPVERPLGEPAVGARHDPVPADELRQAHDALRHELGMLDHVGGVADHPRREHLALGQSHALPHAPFVLVARVRALDEIGPRLDLEHQVDDVLERHVGHVRAGPASPADVIAHPLLGDAGERVVDRLDVHRHPVAVVGEARRRHHPVVGDRETRVVELHIEAGVDDRAVFRAHRIGDRVEQLLVGLVVFVPAVGDHARGRGDRQEPSPRASLTQS
jgi:hypothetical protein